MGHKSFKEKNHTSMATITPDMLGRTGGEVSYQLDVSMLCYQEVIILKCTSSKKLNKNKDYQCLLGTLLQYSHSV